MLNLSSTSITGVTLQALCQLTTLTSLNVSHNFLNSDVELVAGMSISSRKKKERGEAGQGRKREEREKRKKREKRGKKVDYLLNGIGMKSMKQISLVSTQIPLLTLRRLLSMLHLVINR